MNSKRLTLLFALVAIIVVSVTAGRLFSRKPPRPKTSSMTAAQHQVLLQKCMQQVVKGREKTVEGKNFVLCFRDTYHALKVKPAIGTALTDMSKCSRPGGIGSKSRMYTKLENCVLTTAG